MFDGIYHNMIKAHGLRAIIKAPVMPDKSLAIAGDDEMCSLPLKIFAEQGTISNRVVYPSVLETPYEETIPKGSGESLSMDDFVTDDFTLGDSYDSI